MDPIIWIIIGIVAVAAVIVIICTRNNNKKTVAENIRSRESSDSYIMPHKAIATDIQQVGFPVRFELLTSLTETEESALVEIKDPKLLAKIINVIPGTLQVVTNADSLSQYQQTVQNMGQLYQVIIPRGQKLVTDRELSGAVRGFYRNNKGIKGQAHLMPVENNPAAQRIATMNIVNAAINVAALVVGQYYMTQINNQLGTINTELNKIATFQDKEYQGRIYALVAAVQKCSQFQFEIAENEELRKRELDHLKVLEDECAKLLGQANLTLKEYEKNKGLDYSDYEKLLIDAQTWCQYQQILLDVMLKVDELTYALNLGSVSREHCYSVFLPYAKQADEALIALESWHKEIGIALEIDIDASRRRRQGIEGLFWTIPALFNDDLNYKEVSKKTISMIANQSARHNTAPSNVDPDLFKEDVCLIAKDGKVYYLPTRTNGEKSSSGSDIL